MWCVYTDSTKSLVRCPEIVGSPFIKFNAKDTCPNVEAHCTTVQSQTVAPRAKFSEHSVNLCILFGIGAIKRVSPGNGKFPMLATLCNGLSYSITPWNWIKMATELKGAWSDFSEWIFLYSNNASSPKISCFQISFKSVKPFGH